jgi:Protein of unknown function (DUF3253)
MPDAPDADPERIRATILELLQRRDPGKTICPSDAARALAGERFRPLMAPVRDVAAELADEGRIEVTQRGRPVEPRGARGPIRLRLRRDDPEPAPGSD